MFDYVIKRANADPNRAMHCAFGPLSVELNAGDLKTFLTIDKDGARLSTDAPERPIDLNRDSPYEVLRTQKMCLGSVSHAISLHLTAARSVIRSKKDQLAAILC